MRSRAVVLALFLLGVAPGTPAQVTGSLTVQVVDTAGDPLPDAIVRLSNQQGLIATESRATDAQGLVEFPVLRVGGGYVVEISAAGFATRRESDLSIKSGQGAVLAIRMSDEQVERVVVSPRSPIIDLADTSSTTTFSDEFVSELPVLGRFYQNILTLAPGVTDPNNDGNPIVHGSRSRDFQANVSGVSNVDPFSGQSAALVNPNSIEELEVITAGAGVEFGRAQGGFANLVQKQGTNEFEGVAEFLYQSSSLDLTDIDFSVIGYTFTAPEPRDPSFHSIQPSLSFSGPIVRDRAWFRLNHDLIDREIPVNTGDGLVITPETRWLHSDQLTFQASPRNKLQLQYSADDSDNGNVGVSTLIAPASAFDFERKVENLQLNWTAAYSTRILIDSVIAVTTIDNAIGPTDTAATNDCVPLDAFLANGRCTNLNTGEISGPTPLNRDTRSERFTLRSQATIHGGRFAGGTHQFKLGLNIENEQYTQNDVLRPDLTFQEFSVIVLNQPPFKKGFFRTLDVEFNVPGQSELAAKGNAYGFYLEDQYRPFDNVTFTFGLRIDRDEAVANGALPFDPEREFANYQSELNACLAVGEEVGINLFGQCSAAARNAVFTALPDVPAFLEDVEEIVGIPDAVDEVGGDIFQQSFFGTTRRQNTIDITNTNLSPFFSVKWDPFSNGKTAFSASYRRYYDKIFLNVPLLESQPPRTSVLFQLVPEGPYPFVPTTGPLFIPDGRPTLGGVDAAPTIYSVDRDLKTPYQDEFVLTFEREVAVETALRVEYINRKYRDQFQDVDINRVPGDFGRCRRASFNNTSPIVESLGDSYTDEFTGELVIDDTPGPGDGIIDDCGGSVRPAGIVFGSEDLLGEEARVERPDGVPDLYVQNPAFSSILFLNNSNFADYEAYVLTVTRRQFRNWELQASYTYSKAEGNGEDFQQEFGNDQSLTDDEFGFQSTDQRHFLRLLAAVTFARGTRLGGAVRWQSGLPYSFLREQLSFTTTPLPLGGFGGNASQVRTIFPTGERNDERNPSYWTVDLKLTQDARLGRGVNLQFSIEAFNLFNRRYFRIYNDVLQQGRVLNGVPEATIDFGRRWQAGLRMSF